MDGPVRTCWEGTHGQQGQSEDEGEILHITKTGCQDGTHREGEDKQLSILINDNIPRVPRPTRQSGALTPRAPAGLSSK